MSMFIVKSESGEKFLLPAIPFTSKDEAIYNSGREDEKAICGSKHFVAQVQGTGTEALKFHCPFEPQLLFIAGYFPAGYNNAGCIGQLSADLASFSFLAAVTTVYNSSGSLISAPNTAASILTRYSRTEDGEVTIQNVMSTTSSSIGFFGAEIPYLVVACRYTDKTDKERITEYVQSLTGSGEATLAANKVNAAFTEEEWAALTATKPDWVFTLK